ncbi:unnamed protein product [Caretta caretta]
MEMALVLVPAFCLLSGAYTQEWSVRLAPGPLAGGTGSCVTIPCSFTYPAGWTVSAVTWTFTYPAGQTVRAVSWIRDEDQTVYDRDEARVHTDFKGRARYLGDLQRDCSLRVSGLRRSDQGTYRFRFHAAGGGRTDTWGNDLCQPSLGRRTQPGPSLTCSVGATCPHPPLWYNRDGVQRSPEQTPGGAGASELRISPSQLDPGAALRCQVDGYWDECDSDQSQPLGTVTPNVPRVAILWPARKAALREGDGFTLRCQAAALWLIASYTSSLPAPNSYTWYRGDRQLGGSQQEMVLKSITAEQAGEYRCQADNGIGQSPSPPINITVLSTPRVWAPTYILGPAVALVLLLLVGLVGVIAWRKRRSKRQGLSSDPDQPGPGETPMSERIYENTQHYGMGKPARLAPPRAPSVPTEVCPGSPDGTRESHIYSQPMNTGKVPQSDPDEVHYAAVQLQPPTRRAEPTCEYAVIKR